MCPLSHFIRQNEIAPLTIQTAVGPEQTTFIPPQQDLINKTWGQDCGGFTIRLEPELPFLSLSSNAGSSYTDQIILSPVSNDDTGVYTVKVIVSNPGYALPVPGNMDEIEYELTATLNPCPL